MTKNQIIKNTWILYLGAFLANFGIGLINFTLIFFVNTKFNAGSAIIGWMSALWAFGYLVGCLFLNSLRNRLKPRRSIILAATIMGLSILSIPILNSLPLLIFIYMIFGLATSLYWPPLMGWLSKGREGKKLGNTLAIFNLSWSSGLALSPYVAGLIIRRDISLPIYISAILYALIVTFFILVTIFVKEFKQQKEEKVIKDTCDRSSSLRVASWIGNFSAYLFLGTLLFVFPLYAKNEWKMSEDKIGLILLLRAFVSVIGFQISGYSKWWHHKKYQLYITQFILFGICLLLVFIQIPSVMVIAMAVFGLLFSHLYSNSIFHGVSGSIHREKRMAIHEAFLTVGIVVGSAGGGIIYQNSSIQITFLFCALIVLTGLFFQILSVKKQSTY